MYFARNATLRMVFLMGSLGFSACGSTARTGELASGLEICQRLRGGFKVLNSATTKIGTLSFASEPTTDTQDVCHVAITPPEAMPGTDDTLVELVPPAFYKWSVNRGTDGFCHYTRTFEVLVQGGLSDTLTFVDGPGLPLDPGTGACD